jgi:hypothetical protein
MRDSLLIRHFLMRFLDHDLISPQADRHEVLTIACGVLVSSSLFLSVLLAVKYQFNMFLPPGLTAIFALDDRFLLIAMSMLLMALVAVTEWDALSLDARDTAVLGVLPIPRRLIVRTKFTAVALFAAAFAIGWNLSPALLRVAALPVKLPISYMGVIRLILAHAFSGVMAGAFGFLGVFGVRELARALLGPVVFVRVSAGLQAALVIVLTTMLLLLPGSYSRVADGWLSGSRVSPLAVPPLWFVGLHETLAGSVIDGLPRTTPARMFIVSESQATALYRSLWPVYHELALMAVVSLIAVGMVTAAACLWNSRRLPIPLTLHRHRPGAVARARAWVVSTVIARHPLVRAGFSFTLQSLARSVPHRVTLATALAVGLALVVVSVRGRVAVSRIDPAAVPVSFLAAQTLLLAAIAAGFRHAVRIPAEFRGNWTFQVTWSGPLPRYLSGVKRAGWTALIAPACLTLFAWSAILLGPLVAFKHAAVGVLVGATLMEASFMRTRSLPLASGYAPASDVKTMWIVNAVAVLIGAASLAGIERIVLVTTLPYALFVGALALIVVGLRLLDASWQRQSMPMTFAEGPVLPTQRFDLVG